MGGGATKRVPYISISRGRACTDPNYRDPGYYKADMYLGSEDTDLFSHQ